MKINSALPTTGETSLNGISRATPAPAPRAAAAGERVDISAQSVQLQEIGTGEAPLDAQKVAEIKQAISAGRFQINPERIADGLLASVREMLGRTGKSA